MEPYRRSYRINSTGRRRQAGITALGFMLLASVFGVVGLAALKITPLYLQSMRVKTVLSDLKTELDGTGTTAGSLRVNLTSRLYVEGIQPAPEAIRITPAGSGHNVRVQYDNRARYLADIWFLVAIDEQIEIQR